MAYIVRFNEWDKEVYLKHFDTISRMQRLVLQPETVQHLNKLRAAARPVALGTEDMRHSLSTNVRRRKLEFCPKLLKRLGCTVFRGEGKITVVDDKGGILYDVKKGGDYDESVAFDEFLRYVILPRISTQEERDLAKDLNIDGNFYAAVLPSVTMADCVQSVQFERFYRRQDTPSKIMLKRSESTGMGFACTTEKFLPPPPTKENMGIPFLSKGRIRGHTLHFGGGDKMSMSKHAFDTSYNVDPLHNGSRFEGDPVRVKDFFSKGGDLSHFDNVTSDACGYSATTDVDYKNGDHLKSMDPTVTNKVNLEQILQQCRIQKFQLEPSTFIDPEYHDEEGNPTGEVPVVLKRIVLKIAMQRTMAEYPSEINEWQFLLFNKQRPSNLELVVEAFDKRIGTKGYTLSHILNKVAPMIKYGTLMRRFKLDTGRYTERKHLIDDELLNKILAQMDVDDESALRKRPRKIMVNASTYKLGITAKDLPLTIAQELKLEYEDDSSNY